MLNLKGKKILLGISGSIAAYKAVVLVRMLIKAGAEVKVILTPAAKDFVSPLTLSTLSKHPVYSDVSSEVGWHNHVELGLWADAMLIAPATANTLAKMAQGHCDNMLLACYLSSRCPVFFAPAMDLDMWVHPATRHNVRLLQSYGYELLPVGEGELASGLVGPGRMAEPEEICAHLAAFFARQQSLKGYKVLMTAGPTVEPIDPVRYISNHSSGKMAKALAEVLVQRGAEVVYVTGPAPHKPQTGANLRLIEVQTAEQMYQAALAYWPEVQAAILAAAVADYSPVQVAEAKIKKKAEDWQLSLRKTPDIAAELGQRKKAGQLLFGFALETHEAEAHAQDKLRRKNLDRIALNRQGQPGVGFGTDTNQVTMFGAEGLCWTSDLLSKTAIAELIVQELETLLKKV